MPMRRPTEDELRRFLEEQQTLPLSYVETCASARDMPAGYDHDHQRVRLGSGPAVFEAACRALRRWRQFPRQWTEVCPSDTPLAAGNVVAVLTYVLGVWWLNGARIVYSVDEAGPPRRFGVAYGTLPSHVESGEERFLIEMDEAGQVWYEIAAFSRPRHWLLRVGYPLVRWYQAQFRRESAAAMRQAVREAAKEAPEECRR